MNDNVTYAYVDGHNSNRYEWATYGTSYSKLPTDMTGRELSKQQEAELSEDTKTLLKAGFVENHLGLSDTGKWYLIDLMFESFRDRLVERAKELLAKKE